jgi:dienelactone hydrolase
LYAAARKQLPYIIVSPVVLTNGGVDLRGSPKYNYAKSVWDEVDRTGSCRFDLDGLAAIIADVHRRYGGESRAYITGFSAGAHAMWAFVLQHPESVAGAAPASGNYLGRCMAETSFSTEAGRARLPIRSFIGQDELGGALEAQFQSAKHEAEAHGYRNISERSVPGGHDPHADAVLSYFASLTRAGTR